MRDTERHENQGFLNSTSYKHLTKVKLNGTLSTLCTLFWLIDSRLMSIPSWSTGTAGWILDLEQKSGRHMRHMSDSHSTVTKSQIQDYHILSPWQRIQVIFEISWCLVKNWEAFPHSKKRYLEGEFTLEVDQTWGVCRLPMATCHKLASLLAVLACLYVA